MVALGAKKCEILSRIIAKSTAQLNLVDLKIFRSPTNLAASAVRVVQQR